MHARGRKGARSVGRRFGFGLLFVAGLAAPLMWGASATATPRPTATRASCAHAAPARAVAAIAWAGRRGQRLACDNGNGTGGATPPSGAYNGTPPLLFHGGPLVGVSTPGELTVTPIYWVPSGFSMSSSYKNTITRFIKDAAADSGKPTNVFSSNTQYTTASNAKLKYLIHAGAAATVTAAYPANGCTPDSGPIWSDNTPYSKCITNDQLLSEALSYVTAHSLPNDMAHLYMFFLPKGVETCFTSTTAAGGGTCSLTTHPGFCGYHAFAAPPLVANMNYAYVDSPTGYTCSSDAGSNTGGNQTPNGDIEADTEISVASHEISETITDPTGQAYYDTAGYENGDECSYIYGDSVSVLGTQGAKYNQTINGHHYFVQQEFSNQDFNTRSAFSCIQREDAISLSKKSGAAGSAVTVTGGGFAPGEKVKVTYATGLASPKTVAVCTATASNVGDISCSGSIPSGTNAGAAGKHKIVAKGAQTLRKPVATFTRT
jgi:hypothetical protein